LDNFQGLHSLIWTEDRLRKLIVNKTLSTDGTINEESKRLERLIRNNINKATEIIKINSVIPSDKFTNCKRQIHELSKHNGDSNPEINRFIVRSYWLLNLMERSFFPLSHLEDLIVEGGVRALSPKGELEHLRSMVRNVIDPIFKSKMEEIINFLHQTYEVMYNDNPKFQFLKQLICDRSDQKIAVVVHRSYYETVFRKAVPSYEHGKWEITTLKRFREDKFYDYIVFVGMNNWEVVNPLLLGNAPSLIFLLYPSEMNGMNYLMEHTIRRIEVCRSFPNNTDTAKITSYGTNTVSSDDHNRVHNRDEFDFERDLEKFVDGLILESSVKKYLVPASSGNQTSRICRVAFLDTEEKVFFSKFYSAYVFDSVNRTVVETPVPYLKSGDKLIFPNYDDETRDIVEQIMDIMIENENNEKLKQSRLKARYWKLVLQRYMKSRRLSYRELSDELEKCGLKKHEVTLRSWLDKDSHIVGPRDKESFRVVAQLTKDPKLIKNPDVFWKACNDVRSMRIRILRFIGKNIVRTYGRENVDQEDELLSQMPINVSKMTRLVEIEKIVDTDNLFVAANCANKPIMD
jgi:hypothetical protein